MAKVYRNPGLLEFESIIKCNTDVDNSSAWVEFPYNLKETFGVGNLVPVNVLFDGHVKYQGSLAKMGGPSAILILRKGVRAELGKESGEKVNVQVELDDTKREVHIGKDVERAYKAAGVWETFKKYPHSHQRQYDMWIEDANKPETRERRINKSVEALRDKQKEQR